MTPIKTRICQYLDYKRIKKKTFFKTFNIASSSFRGRNADSEMTAERIASITNIYTDLNIKWLLMGIGDMLLPDNQPVADTPSAQSASLSREPVSAAAETAAIAGEKRGRGRPRKIVMPEAPEAEPAKPDPSASAEYLTPPSNPDHLFSEKPFNRPLPASDEEMMKYIHYYYNLYLEEKAFSEQCLQMIKMLNNRIDQLVKRDEERMRRYW